MSGLLSIGQSALLAAYAQLQTAGHNVANANTVGYSRQEVLLATTEGQFTGSGFVGRGVDIVTVQRRYDEFVATELARSIASAAADSARAGMLERVDTLLADTDNGIGAALDDLDAALADLANRPFDASAREAVLARADALAARFSAVDGALRRLDTEAQGRIGQEVALANDLLARIAKVNERIAATTGTGQPPNDLLDERDRLLRELNGHLRTTSYVQPDGTVSVFAAGGEGLLVGNRAARLVLEVDPVDTTRQRLVMVTGDTRLPMNSDALGAGSIAGLMRFCEQDAQAFRAQLGQLAAAIAAAFNDQQARGVDATGTAGAPLFALGAPDVASASSNTGSAVLEASLLDGTQVAASDYSIRFAAGQYVVTRIADGLQRTFGSLPQQLDGLGIGLRSGVVAEGDVFVLHSASGFASGFARALSSGAGLASGYAASAAASAANTGDVAVSSFSVATADANLAQRVTLVFRSSSIFDVSGVGTGDPAGVSFVPGAPIAFNGWSLVLRGTPQPGDRIEIVPTRDPAADNRNVRAMLSLSDQPLAGGARFGEAFAGLIAETGLRTASAQAAEALSTRLQQEAEAARSNASGVDLDEEAARLMQYQQLYQAATRVIQAAQSMFDELLDIVGR